MGISTFIVGLVVGVAVGFFLKKYVDKITCPSCVRLPYEINDPSLSEGKHKLAYVSKEDEVHLRQQNYPSTNGKGPQMYYNSATGKLSVAPGPNEEKQ